jgi:cholesterol transport system auxiliary component
MKRSVRRLIGMMLMPLFLAACSSGSTVLETYDLSALPSGAARAVPLGQLIVAEPKALANLDTDRIAVKQADGAVAYLPGAGWGDRLPRLVQSRMIQSLENAGGLKAIGRPGDRLTSDWQLVSELRSFELSVDAGNEARIEIAAKLVNDRSGRILRGKVFSARVPASGTDPRAVAQAFDAALLIVLRDLVSWAGGRG